MKRNTGSSLCRIKQNTADAIVIIMIASLFVLPGCSSVKENSDDNPMIPENSAEIDVQDNQSIPSSNTESNKAPDSEFASNIDFLLNTPDTDVLKAFGEAEEKTEAVVWDADGLKHQTWKYPSLGIVFDMVEDSSKQGIQIVKSISISTPSSYKTSRGIGIGNTGDEVLAAYKAEIEEENISESKIIAGSVYDGIIFHLEDDMVSSIFIGAAAE